MTSDAAPQRDPETPDGPLDRLSIGWRVVLPVLAGLLGAVLVLVGVWMGGTAVRDAWSGLRSEIERRDDLLALERVTARLNREAVAHLDRPDEETRTTYEDLKSAFTAALWQVRDGLQQGEAEDFVEFSEAARRFLVGFDDLRGLEIDVALLYETTFGDVTAAVRERLDALELAIRPGDFELRPQLAVAYDRFAEIRVALVAYRHDRRQERIEAARRARDELATALMEIGRRPTPDSRGYAVERIHPALVDLDGLLDRLVAISWRKTLWLSGFVDGNRETMLAALDRLVAGSTARQAATTTAFQLVLEQTGYRLVGGLLAALVGGFVVARLSARSIGRGLERLTAAMRAVVGGDHERPIGGLDGSDEISGAARALETFRREVANLRRSEEAHDAQERRWFSILETSPVAIAVLAAETGARIVCNRRWRELFPLDAEGHDATALGNGLAAHFADPDEAADLSRAVLAGGGVTARRVAMRRPDGRPWWARIDVRAVEFAARPATILWVYDDTERREAEEAVRVARDRAEAALERLARARDDLVEAEKLATVGGLVAGVAHEVNNPVGIGLTVASTLARRTDAFAAEVATGALRRSRLDDFVAGVRDAAAQLVANLGRAADLVLAFKQVAVDRTHPDRRAYDLAAVTEQIAASLRPRLKTTSHVFEVDVAEGLAMDGYPGAWGQVVTNLLLNALGHAFREDHVGRVTLTARAEGEDRVGIVFADDGRGMSAEEARRAFEPFFTTRRGEGGSGLGLHIVRNIVVQRLGGRIAMTSEPGRGTRFDIILPRVAPADARSVSPGDGGDAA